MKNSTNRFDPINITAAPIGASKKAAIRATISALALVWLAALGQAQTYYTVDVTNDDLYKINVTTGVATKVGPLGIDINAADLTWHQGALYAGTNNASDVHRVLQIVTTGVFAGTALAGAPLNGGGYQGAEAGALASDGNSLYICYSNQKPVDFYSTNFGKVNPVTGTISFVSTIPTDADAMGYVGGKFWTMDVINPSSGYQLFNGTTIPNTYVGGDTYDNSLLTNPVDIENYSATLLVTVGQGGRHLVLVNKASGLRGVSTPITGIPSNAVMKGIAYDPGCSIRPIEIHRE